MNFDFADDEHVINAVEASSVQNTSTDDRGVEEILREKKVFLLTPELVGKRINSINAIITRDPLKRIKRAILQKSFHQWSLVYPVMQKCDEIGRQLQERNHLIGVVKESYVRDVLSVKWHLDNLSEAVKKTDLDKIEPIPTDNLPSTDLRALISKCQEEPHRSSTQFRDTLIRAGLLHPSVDRQLFPWEASKSFKNILKVEWGRGYRTPLTGEVVPIYAPGKHTLFVNYCKECVGVMSLVFKWNEDVEGALAMWSERERSNFESTRQARVRATITNLNQALNDQALEIQQLRNKLQQNQQSKEWMGQWETAVNFENDKKRLLGRIVEQKNATGMAVCDRESSELRSVGNYTTQCANYEKTIEELKTELSIAKKNCEVKDQQVIELTNKVNLGSTLCDSLRAQISTHLTTIQDRDLEILSLNNNIESLESKLRISIQDRQTKEVDHTKAKKKLEETIAELRLSIEELNKELEKMDSDADGLRDQIRGHRYENMELRNEIKDHEQKYNELQGVYDAYRDTVSKTMCLKYRRSIKTVALSFLFVIRNARKNMQRASNARFIRKRDTRFQLILDGIIEPPSYYTKDMDEARLAAITEYENKKKEEALLLKKDIVDHVYNGITGSHVNVTGKYEVKRRVIQGKGTRTKGIEVEYYDVVAYFTEDELFENTCMAQAETEQLHYERHLAYLNALDALKKESKKAGGEYVFNSQNQRILGFHLEKLLFSMRCKLKLLQYQEDSCLTTNKTILEEVKENSVEDLEKIASPELGVEGSISLSLQESIIEEGDDETVSAEEEEINLDTAVNSKCKPAISRFQTFVNGFLQQMRVWKATRPLTIFDLKKARESFRQDNATIEELLEDGLEQSASDEVSEGQNSLLQFMDEESKVIAYCEQIKMEFQMFYEHTSYLIAEHSKVNMELVTAKSDVVRYQQVETLLKSEIKLKNRALKDFKKSTFSAPKRDSDVQSKRTMSTRNRGHHGHRHRDKEGGGGRERRSSSRRGGSSSRRQSVSSRRMSRSGSKSGSKSEIFGGSQDVPVSGKPPLGRKASSRSNAIGSRASVRKSSKASAISAFSTSTTGKSSGKPFNFSIGERRSSVNSPGMTASGIISTPSGSLSRKLSVQEIKEFKELKRKKTEQSQLLNAFVDGSFAEASEFLDAVRMVNEVSDDSDEDGEEKSELKMKSLTRRASSKMSLKKSESHDSEGDHNDDEEEPEEDDDDLDLEDLLDGDSDGTIDIDENDLSDSEASAAYSELLYSNRRAMFDQFKKYSIYSMNNVHYLRRHCIIPAIRHYAKFYTISGGFSRGPKSGRESFILGGGLDQASSVRLASGLASRSSAHSPTPSELELMEEEALLAANMEPSEDINDLALVANEATNIEKVPVSGEGLSPVILDDGECEKQGEDNEIDAENDEEDEYDEDDDEYDDEDSYNSDEYSGYSSLLSEDFTIPMEKLSPVYRRWKRLILRTMVADLDVEVEEVLYKPPTIIEKVVLDDQSERLTNKLHEMEKTHAMNTKTIDMLEVQMGKYRQDIARHERVTYDLQQEISRLIKELAILKENYDYSYSENSLLRMAVEDGYRNTADQITAVITTHVKNQRAEVQAKRNNQADASTQVACTVCDIRERHGHKPPNPDDDELNYIPPVPVVVDDTVGIVDTEPLSVKILRNAKAGLLIPIAPYQLDSNKCLPCAGTPHRSISPEVPPTSNRVQFDSKAFLKPPGEGSSMTRPQSAAAAISNDNVLIRRAKADTIRQLDMDLSAAMGKKQPESNPVSIRPHSAFPLDPTLRVAVEFPLVSPEDSNSLRKDRVSRPGISTSSSMTKFTRIKNIPSGKNPNYVMKFSGEDTQQRDS